MWCCGVSSLIILPNTRQSACPTRIAGDLLPSCLLTLSIEVENSVHFTSVLVYTEYKNECDTSATLGHAPSSQGTLCGSDPHN